VDFVEICNVCTRKVTIKAAKRIFNSDKICGSYCDFYFGVTFLEHTVETSFAVNKCIDMLNRSGVTHQCDRQTDGRTDGQTVGGTGILLVNANLIYIARPKVKIYLIFYIISLTN